MEHAALIASLQELLPSGQIEAVASVDLQSTIYVPVDAWPAMARTLRDRSDLAFTFLAELTAVDFWPREPRFEIVYLLVSLTNLHRLRVKVRVGGEQPHLQTVSDIWPGANWLEREVWDLFGVVFDGHPNLQRLLMPEDWDGFPLRKDYPVQIRMTPRSAEPLQVSEEEFRANLARDRAGRPRSDTSTSTHGD